MSRACITFNILLDFTLTRKEIALYGIIEHMESDGKHVFYNNATLAKMLDVGEESKMVSRMCRNLKAKGYITREHKQIPMKKKNGETILVWRWCWNTIKHAMMTDFDGEESDNDDTGGVLPSHPKGVPPVHPPVVPPVHPYNNPLSLDPLKTTTTCSSSFSSFENKALEFKHSTDERTDDEFIEHVRHHVKFNSDPDSGDYQRKQMILKLLKNLHANAEHFKSKGYVPVRVQEEKKQIDNEKQMAMMKNSYDNYYNSWVEQDLRSKGIESKTFEQWIESNV